jgi:integrase
VILERAFVAALLIAHRTPGAYMAPWDHIRRFPSDSGLVSTAGGGTVLRDTNFRRRVRGPAVTAAGLEGLHFHDLRHSHAALLIAAGEHVKVIQSRLGHANARMTLDVDGHLFDGLDEAAVERLDGAVSEAAVRILRGFGEVADLD